MNLFELRQRTSPPSYDAAVDTRTPFPDCRRPEDEENNPIPGWPKFSNLITTNPGLEAFPSYRDLNIKSLLYYQAELDTLREKLYKRELYDYNALQSLPESERGAHPHPAEDVDHLLAMEDDGNDLNAEPAQRDLIVEIRKVLKAYNEALIQYSQITSFPKADPFNVESLRTSIINLRLKNSKIWGHGTKTWGVTKATVPGKIKIGRRTLQFLLSLVWSKKPQENDLDLIVPRTGHTIDGFTHWLGNEWVPFWVDVCRWYKERKSRPSDPEHPRENHQQGNTLSQGPPSSYKKVKTLNTFSQHRMLQVTSSLATVVACALPIAAITVLSKLHTNAKILGIIALFTVVFSGGLMFLSGGTSRVEIFTATSAFAAVMVVFVQNQNSNSNSQGVGSQ
ncbi:hypothetical protein BGZ60DRAFT_557793 [Tricladium varicosporioides]|nr:hypothetical protein BGZ60DRAFT_557793 [Hymenoscyphus varicosporioides]